MSSLQDLDDPTKTCIYLAPRDDLDGERSGVPTNGGLHSRFSSRDIPEGHILRLKAYQQAWSKCLERVQSIVRGLHAPIVSSVVSHIHEAHSGYRTLPGIPYPEIPVIAISLPGGSSILDDILNDLDKVEQPGKKRFANGSKRKGKGRAVDDDDDDMAAESSTARATQSRPRSIIAHISPSECPNLMTTMKAIVSGFVDKSSATDDEGDEDDDLHLHALKRKPTTSLASYDMNLLESWYTALQERSDSKSQLLIVMHDFEQFDTTMLQDVFDICSQHVSSLPLLFLAAFSAPSALTYIRGTFPRSTLALLRIQTISAPSGAGVLEDVLVKTFFDADFEPDVMVGPATLDYLVENGTRHTASIDAMLTILQLAHMKHFEEPLTVFVHDSQLGTSSESEASAKLHQPTSFNFLDSLLGRLWPNVADQQTLDPIQLDEQAPTVESLLAAASAARTQARRQSQKMRIGFQAMFLVRKFMHVQGYKVSSSRPEENELELMTRVVRGRVSKDVKYLGLMVKKLNAKQLGILLQSLHYFFHSLQSPSLRREEENARVCIVTAIAQLPRDAPSDSEQDASTVQIAAGIGEWLVEYIETRLIRLDQGVLWDIWNTGTTPFPSELINPAPRLAIINALLHPYEFVDAHRDLFKRTTNEDSNVVNDSTISERQYDLWELPDTSILFRRYMDSGRMINVYDWYESFAVALDTQRDQLRKQKKRQQNVVKGKGKKRAAEEEDVEMDDEEDVDEEAEERWSKEVQARFMRSLHELDFMGFIKHTGRKADHVMKTIYDIPD